ncbi:MAG: sugar phosphate isomerase/epimerase [Spirochaetia bacterium]|jgi:sugar phosphate isomerase/epimerase|nr:sugar phosphate isomerase/epimerase [Spirochaetia bacterium]
MKLSYQVAMPEVAASHLLTAYKGSLTEGFRLLKDHGYDAAELMICETNQDSVSSIRHLIREYNIGISMLVTGELYSHEGLSLSCHDPHVREKCIHRFYDFIDIATEFDAQVNIGRVRGLYEPSVPHEQTYKLAVDSLQNVVRYAEQKKVTLILEPVNFLQCDFILSTQDSRNLVDEIGSPYFKIMLDVFHMNIQDRNICEEIHRSKGYFTYVHLSDNNRLYPGNCGLNFAEIITALRKTAYDGYLAVEILQQPDAVTAIRESARHILPLIK